MAKLLTENILGKKCERLRNNGLIWESDAKILK